MLRRAKKDIKSGGVEPTDGSEVTAGMIRKRYEDGCKAIRLQTFNYWLNFAYLNNHQWLFMNQQTRRLEELPRDPDRVQATINKLLPASRTVLAKASSRDLRFDVPPTQADDDTVRSARLSEAILRDVAREHDWEDLRESSLWQVWRGGTAAVCVDWDAAAGIPLDTTENGKRVGTGDTVETALSIAEFTVEPGARIAEKARWWVKAEALPPEEVQARFKLSEKPEADATAGMSPLQQRLLAEQGNSGSEQPDLTLVLTYYERPNHLRQNGAVAVVVGNKIVDGPHPWPFPWKDRLNIAVMVETKIDGRWSGETVLTSARSVQTALNASWSSIIEHMKLAGNARLAVPQSAADMIEVLSDEPGELLPFPDGVTPPIWLSPPQMPAWWIEQPERLKEELDDILGVHAISRGDAPNNIQSGYGLSILAENDATPLGRLVKAHASMWAHVARMVLRLYEDKATETRTAKVLHAGQAPETAAWTGKDINGQTEAIVPPDAVMPRSRAAQQMFADKAMQMGLIQNVAQYAKIAEYPEADDLIGAVSPDISRARRENHILALSRVALPESWDKHDVHIQEHNDFRKSARFSQLDDHTRNLFELHIKGHEVLAAEGVGRTVMAGQVSPALAAMPTANQDPSIAGGDMGEMAEPGEAPGTGSPAQVQALPPMPPNLS